MESIENLVTGFLKENKHILQVNENYFLDELNQGRQAEEERPPLAVEELVVGAISGMAEGVWLNHQHMPFSGSEQQQIQMKVDAASKEERQEMCDSAEAVLLRINMLGYQKILSTKERKPAVEAIEILTRVEATEKGKGALFRMKRRLQLTIEFCRFRL